MSSDPYPLLIVHGCNAVPIVRGEVNKTTSEKGVAEYCEVR